MGSGERSGGVAGRNRPARGLRSLLILCCASVRFMSDAASILDYLSPALKGGGALGVAVGVAKGFEWFDGAMSPEARVWLSKWLTNVPGDEQIAAWVNVFPNLIDRVFGQRAISWRFLFTSCIASLIAVTTMTGFFFSAFAGLPYPVLHDKTALLTIMIFLGLTVNCALDYFSLLISRFIVRAMARSPRPIMILLLLLGDMLLTGTLSIVALRLLTPAGIGLAVGMEHSWPLWSSGYPSQPDLFDAIFLGYQGVSPFPINLSNAIYMIKEPFTRTFIFASFFPSIWVWLYVLASTSIRTFNKVRFIWTKIVPFLNVKEKPMMAIGRVAGILAGLGYLCVLGAEWGYQRLH